MSFYISGQSAEMIINNFKHKVFTRAPKAEIKVEIKPKKKKIMFQMEENLEMGETLDIANNQRVKGWADVPTGVSTRINLGKWPAPEWDKNIKHRGLTYQANKWHHFKNLEMKFKPFKKGKSMMYNVQLIAGHRVNKSVPEVLVKWYGFECPTWEAWSNVKNTVNAKAYAYDESLTFEDKCIVVKIDDEVSEEIA